MNVKRQKVSCTLGSLLTVPHLGKDAGRMIAGYPSSRRGMVGPAAYSLTQQTTRMRARRAVVCRVTRWLARQGTRQVEDYNRRIVVLKEVRDFFLKEKTLTHI